MLLCAPPSRQVEQRKHIVLNTWHNLFVFNLDFVLKLWQHCTQIEKHSAGRFSDNMKTWFRARLASQGFFPFCCSHYILKHSRLQQKSDALGGNQLQFMKWKKIIKFENFSSSPRWMVVGIVSCVLARWWRWKSCCQLSYIPEVEIFDSWIVFIYINESPDTGQRSDCSQWAIERRNQAQRSTVKIEFQVTFADFIDWSRSWRTAK